jgi:hypothetical protein
MNTPVWARITYAELTENCPIWVLGELLVGFGW